MIEKVDFQHSLIKWLTLKESSEASIAVDSLCILRNVAGSICTYALGPEVIAGTVYAKHPTALKPAYLFQMIASSSRHSILRYCLKHRVNSDSCRDNSDIFLSLSVHIKKRSVVVLDNFDQIESAFDQGLILSAVVMWKNDCTAVEIEFPVKHLNI